MTRGLDSVKKKMLAEREVRTAYAALDEEFALARELIAAGRRARSRWFHTSSTGGSYGYDSIGHSTA